MRHTNIAIDFDGTIRDTTTNTPISGVKEVLGKLREASVEIIIHSCNRPSFVERWMNDYGLPFDYIWDEKGKPIADLYIDDRAFHFTGSWGDDIDYLLGRLGL